VDLLYECKTRLFVSAATKLDGLLSSDGDEKAGSEKNVAYAVDFAEISVSGEGGSSSSNATTSFKDKKTGAVTEWSATGLKEASLQCGDSETAFQFGRLQSRLVEMQSREYRDRWQVRTGPSR
jgi:predicted ATPase